MARIRSLKPEFFRDDELAELPPIARLLFQGLWGLADKEGRLEDRPKRIKVEVLPYDDCDIDELLDLLSDKFIKRYQVDGESYIWIVKFKEHQRITGKEAETQSRIPEYTGKKQRGNTGETPETTGREGKGKELGEEGKGFVKGKGLPPASPTPTGVHEFASVVKFLPESWSSVGSAWADYQEHRRKTPGVSPYQEAGCQKLAAMLLAENYVPDKFIRLLDHCLASGWKGIPIEVLQKFEHSNGKSPKTLTGMVDTMMEESEFGKHPRELPQTVG